jgi:C4-dicarboxylate-specific signal transduction histidine kinase
LENKQKTSEEYELEITKLKRINKALMDRVERSTSLQGGAFSLFESNVLLSKEVANRTKDLNQINEILKEDKTKLTQILIALPGNSIIFNNEFVIQEYFYGTRADNYNIQIGDKLDKYFSIDFVNWISKCIDHKKIFSYFEFKDIIKEKYFHLTFSKINEQSFIIFIRDITEDINAQKLIKEKDSIIIQASKLSALGEMAGGIAHEINNPLGIIDGYAKRILRTIEKNEIQAPELVNYTDKIVETVVRIAKIVNGLRQVSRDAANDELEQVLIHELISDSVAMSTEKFKANGVAFTFSCDDQLYIKCKRIQFSQVLINLLNNSYYVAKELPEKWIKIIVKKVENNKCRIYVIDSGKGIKPEILLKVFNPFFTTKKVGDGTGLGMSISKNIVNDHNGILDYELYEGNTAFYIEIAIANN